MTREPDPPLRRAGAHEQRRMNRLEMRPVTTRGIQLPDRRERLADLRVPLTDFRRDQQVRVRHDNEPALFLALVVPANGTEPWAILQTFTGTSDRAVRISDVAQYDGRLG